MSVANFIASAGDYLPWYADSKSAIMILLIPSIAFITLPDFSLSPSLKYLPKTGGVTCQLNPNRSFNHPHGPFCPPSLVNPSHNSSISSCVSAVIKKLVASLNLYMGPPFKAMKFNPSKTNDTLITEPGVTGLGAPSP